MKKKMMISTRILIISDTHAHLALPPADDSGSPVAVVVPFHQPLPSADVLIHCGDLTMNGALSQHEAALSLLTSAKAELKIVIPGNHDITLDREYYARFPRLHATYDRYSGDTLDQIRELYTGPRARDAGIRYLEEGVAGFTLRNGARLNVYASAWTPEFFNWAFGYARDVDRFNPQLGGGGGGSGPAPAPAFPVPEHGEIDIMITHGPPRELLDRVWRGVGKEGEEDVGCDHLRKAVERCRPRVHCFGHIHEAWGAVWKRWDVRPPEAEGGDITAGDVQSLYGEQRQRQQPPAHLQPETSSVAKDPDPEPEPNPPYHPIHNPNSYYMYTPKTPSTPTTTNQHHRGQAGETLLQPSAYEEQVRQMCAGPVDARGLEFGTETLFVNASIMNLRYRPVNAPWVVDVMLPEAETGDSE
ncbi:uncharacterized protein Z520_08050 [Fonsecaea multimorphosa CBS 102226]|uniref:Calcineurin-like phosphoesterase domain-containing protein n=1 Tax=Fonsecaea multimorphosa CBS 102226 TaxID=1442371 RepID=A0A0D2JS40_9EURO|nr:uncharacterized protein Z520_08050 [Fonsecaea multimorphosa CBS 102226]KIX96272.1 hypothetical protein Z520_08050 [Fonsecaea multimorphosa CBS 102226]OAL21934.1 hypothetical protein AYO22_07531 [Fonsecaea multimorphosa]